LPASASPAGFIITPAGWKCKPRPHQGGGIFNRNYAEISAGIDSPAKTRLTLPGCARNSI
jgi:hypothetical protein